MRQAIEWSSERAGVEGWTFKTLRTTWATRASEIGIEEWLISEVLNHASATVTQRHYIHNRYRYADQKRSAMVRYADRLSVELGEGRSKVLPFR